MEMYKPLHEDVHVPLYCNAEDDVYDEMNKVENEERKQPKVKGGKIRTTLGAIGIFGEWIANETTGYGDKKEE